MNRKFKALGLALVAALALTAVMASTASAQFTSSSTHTILSGFQEGNHVFTAGEGFGSIKCTTATFSGTATGYTVTVNWRVRSTTTGSFFNCGVSEGEHTEGTFFGTTNVTGVDTTGKAVTISVD